jgi:hypothetical protein
LETPCNRATVIVVSILFAFAIDAWWEERGERKAEVLLLEWLRADYTEIQSVLILVEEEHRKARDACIFLMDIAVGQSLPATAEVDHMIAVVFLASRTFNPGSGAVASFHSGEGARLVRNQLIFPHDTGHRIKNHNGNDSKRGVR